MLHLLSCKTFKNILMYESTRYCSYVVNRSQHVRHTAFTFGPLSCRSVAAVKGSQMDEFHVWSVNKVFADWRLYAAAGLLHAEHSHGLQGLHQGGRGDFVLSSQLPCRALQPPVAASKGSQARRLGVGPHRLEHRARRVGLYFCAGR